jgi:serine/threonine protein kinase
MATPDWNRIQELFHQACELDEPERSAFLDGECGDRKDERRLVERLLRRDADPAKLLDAEPGQLASLLVDTRDELPKSIGPYVVDRLIGRGGMGVVVLAERPDLPRKVALKLVRDRWLGSAAIQHSKREQAALARLQHPHIARLLDVGTADDGTPYLTMDYVDGKQVTDYCA